MPASFRFKTTTCSNAGWTSSAASPGHADTIGPGRCADENRDALLAMERVEDAEL